MDQDGKGYPYGSAAPNRRPMRERLLGRMQESRRALVWPFRRATARRRCLPTMVIIGAQKSGTSSLFSYLARHPSLLPAYRKEVHYFDLNFERGVDWYRAHFPLRGHSTARADAGDPPLAYEASPYYMAHPLAPYRIRGLLPNVKLIVLLRDPVARTISHYNHERAKGREELSLPDAIELEPKRLDGDAAAFFSSPLYGSRNHRHFSYLARGRYAEQLQAWLSLFPREQLLIIDAAQLFRDPALVISRVCEFSTVSPHFSARYEVKGGRSYDPPDPSVERWLRDYFAPHNQRLWKLIGEDFGWT